MTPPAIDPALAAWEVDPDKFPEDGLLAEQLAFLVRYAVLAPSGHNTQPWQFRIVDDVLELWADRSRGLPVVDPEDRELVISCGAALFHLRAAGQAHGLRLIVEVLPEGPRSDLLARVGPDGTQGTIPDVDELVAAIPRRRTNRAAFEDRPVPPSLLERLTGEVVEEGARLAAVRDSDTQHRIAELVADGDRRQMADRRFRRELAAWLRPNTSSAPDGLRGHGFGFPDIMSHLGPLVMRTFDLGNSQAAKDEEIAAGAPALVAVCTDRDDPEAWLATGQALARLLLRVHASELWASYLNQPIEVEELRSELADLLGQCPHPQLLLRLGYGPMPQPQPRRTVAEVLTR
ncbi:MAG: nitroreductase family protein [Nitriliruptoraceae bacterium]